MKKLRGLSPVPPNGGDPVPRKRGDPVPYPRSCNSCNEGAATAATSAGSMDLRAATAATEERVCGCNCCNTGDRRCSWCRVADTRIFKIFFKFLPIIYCIYIYFINYLYIGNCKKSVCGSCGRKVRGVLKTTYSQKIEKVLQPLQHCHLPRLYNMCYLVILQVFSNRFISIVWG